MDPLTWAQALDVYRDYGVAGLFLVLYLVTVTMLIRSLTKGRDKEISRCMQLAMLAERMAEASESQALILEKLKESIDTERNATERLHVYLEARDQGRKGHERKAQGG